MAEKSPRTRRSTKSKTTSAAKGVATSKTTVPARTQGTDLYKGSNGESALNIPEYDAAALMPTDLYSVSSSAPRLTKAEADDRVEAINEQREGQRVVSASLSLIDDVAGNAIKRQKIAGKAIQWVQENVRNQTRMVDLDRMRVDLQISESKLTQTQEKLTQQEMETASTQAQTPLIAEKIEATKARLKARIMDIKNSAMDAQEKLQKQARAITSDAEDLEV